MFFSLQGEDKQHRQCFSERLIDINKIWANTCKLPSSTQQGTTLFNVWLLWIPNNLWLILTMQSVSWIPGSQWLQYSHTTVGSNSTVTKYHRYLPHYWSLLFKLLPVQLLFYFTLRDIRIFKLYSYEYKYPNKDLPNVILVVH